MNEIIIGTSLPSPQQRSSEIKIFIENKIDKGLVYRFVIGYEGTWKTIKDFSQDDYVVWKPEQDGKYIILVLGKKQGSKKSHDYSSRTDFLIGSIEENLIKDIELSSSNIKIGDKLQVQVMTVKLPILCRYWLKEDYNWSLIKDYSPDTNLVFTPRNEGNLELLVECKDERSQNEFDDFKTIPFNVSPMEKIKITDFKCLTEDLVVDNEVFFEVNACADEKMNLIYKFIKIYEDGKTEVVRDFSSKRLVGFHEKNPGNYRLLCIVKDMYSQNSYDDRAVIYYKVAPYKPVKILSFTSDLSSPQINGTPIEFKCICSGGQNLFYKFIIDGNASESSKYISNGSYKWTPKQCGQYKIEVLVKDKRCDGDYEDRAEIEFSIDEDYTRGIYIDEVILNKRKDLLIGEPLNISVNAVGGDELLYSFNIVKDEEQIEILEYNDKNYLEFIPQNIGKYEIEVKVKHPKSKRVYDAHSVIYIECKEFIPAKIDYILWDNKDYYLIEEDIFFEVIVENTKSTLVKYKIKINNRDVEEIEYGKDKKIKIHPKCSGSYTIEIYGKNLFSTKEYDAKKVINFKVLEGPILANCNITVDKEELKQNEPVNITVNCDGGKDVMYEFYLMEKGEWKLIQRYSKKSYYTFIPFYKGYYKILALCKSSYANCQYEDYGTLELDIK